MLGDGEENFWRGDSLLSRTYCGDLSTNNNFVFCGAGGLNPLSEHNPE